MIKPEDYGLTLEQAAAADTLSAGTREYIYRKQKHAYQALDAASHCKDILEDDQDRIAMLSNEDYDAMADLFENMHDCNVDENSLWEEVVRGYLKGKGIPT